MLRLKSRIFDSTRHLAERFGRYGQSRTIGRFADRLGKINKVPAADHPTTDKVPSASSSQTTPILAAVSRTATANPVAPRDRVERLIREGQLSKAKSLRDQEVSAGRWSLRDDAAILQHLVDKEISAWGNKVGAAPPSSLPLLFDRTAECSDGVFSSILPAESPLPPAECRGAFDSSRCFDVWREVFLSPSSLSSSDAAGSAWTTVRHLLRAALVEVESRSQPSPLADFNSSVQSAIDMTSDVFLNALQPDQEKAAADVEGNDSEQCLIRFLLAPFIAPSDGSPSQQPIDMLSQVVVPRPLSDVTCPPVELAFVSLLAFLLRQCPTVASKLETAEWLVVTHVSPNISDPARRVSFATAVVMSLVLTAAPDDPVALAGFEKWMPACLRSEQRLVVFFHLTNLLDDALDYDRLAEWTKPFVGWLSDAIPAEKVIIDSREVMMYGKFDAARYLSRVIRFPGTNVCTFLPSPDASAPLNGWRKLFLSSALKLLNGVKEKDELSVSLFLLPAPSKVLLSDVGSLAADALLSPTADERVCVKIIEAFSRAIAEKRKLSESIGESQQPPVANSGERKTRMSLVDALLGSEVFVNDVLLYDGMTSDVIARRASVLSQTFFLSTKTLGDGGMSFVASSVCASPIALSVSSKRCLLLRGGWSERVACLASTPRRRGDLLQADEDERLVSAIISASQNGAGCEETSRRVAARVLAAGVLRDVVRRWLWMVPRPQTTTEGDVTRYSDQARGVLGVVEQALSDFTSRQVSGPVVLELCTMLTLAIPTFMTRDGCRGSLQFTSFERLFRAIGRDTMSFYLLKRVSRDAIVCASRVSGGNISLESDLLHSCPLLAPPGEHRNPYVLLPSAPASCKFSSCRLLVLRPRVQDYTGLRCAAESILTERLEFHARRDSEAAEHMMGRWQRAVRLFASVVVEPDDMYLVTPPVLAAMISALGHSSTCYLSAAKFALWCACSFNGPMRSGDLLRDHVLYFFQLQHQRQFDCAGAWSEHIKAFGGHGRGQLKAFFSELILTMIREGKTSEAKMCLSDEALKHPPARLLEPFSPVGDILHETQWLPLVGQLLPDDMRRDLLAKSNAERPRPGIPIPPREAKQTPTPADWWKEVDKHIGVKDWVGALALASRRIVCAEAEQLRSQDHMSVGRIVRKALHATVVAGAWSGALSVYVYAQSLRDAQSLPQPNAQIENNVWDAKMSAKLGLLLSAERRWEEAIRVFTQTLNEAGDDDISVAFSIAAYTLAASQQRQMVPMMWAAWRAARGSDAAASPEMTHQALHATAHHKTRHFATKMLLSMVPTSRPASGDAEKDDWSFSRVLPMHPDSATVVGKIIDYQWLKCNLGFRKALDVATLTKDTEVLISAARLARREEEIRSVYAAIQNSSLKLSRPQNDSLRRMLVAAKRHPVRTSAAAADAALEETLGRDELR